jgi:hypothetical protein
LLPDTCSAGAVPLFGGGDVVGEVVGDVVGEVVRVGDAVGEAVRVGDVVGGGVVGGGVVPAGDDVVTPPVQTVPLSVNDVGTLLATLFQLALKPTPV